MLGQDLRAADAASSRPRLAGGGGRGEAVASAAAAATIVVLLLLIVIVVVVVILVAAVVSGFLTEILLRFDLKLAELFEKRIERSVRLRSVAGSEPYLRVGLGNDGCACEASRRPDALLHRSMFTTKKKKEGLNRKFLENLIE